MQQPSQTAIERELEALRDIRRRSTAQGGPGALLLDPDLPAEQPTKTPPLSPQAWTSDEQGSARKDTDNASTSSSSGEGSTQTADDPFHLFWVPAHLHPELAPKEFKMFLKEHARGPMEGSSVLLNRSSSVSSVGSSGGLDRKRSMLSRQYKPREGESINEEEHIVPIRRNRSVYGQDGPKLTISDLQKLEELADEASKSDDPTKLRRVIRRSLSLNVAPSSVLDTMDDVPDVGDDADAPIIVPKPNQILRRAARTKIRKPGLAGDGGGHRFPAARRKSARAATIDAYPTYEQRSSGELSDFESHRRPPLPNRRSEEDSDEGFDQRRNTFTDIYDAYTDGPDDMHHLSTSPPPIPVDRPVSPPPPVPPIPPLHSEPTLHQPQPQRPLSPVLQQQPTEPTRSPSPESPAAVTSAPMDELRRVDPRIAEAPTVPNSSPSLGDKRKEKEKKSILKKWGGSGDKSAKKNGKEKEREKEKEKDSGFFGSLFGGKKKQDEPASTLGTGSGPATAAALLGASKTSKGYTPSISPQLGNPYARYPIHVERAVYRLSHIKLANPRRPLYEQVLISNLMFWYLGVINKAQQGPAANGANNSANQQVQQAPSNTQGAGAGTGAQPQQEERESESSERQKRQEQERERAPAPEPKRDGRRGSLTKTPQPGSSAAAGRRAEMPVKGPEYGLQHQVLEQEYGPGPPTVGGSNGRGGSSSPQGGSPSNYSNRGGYAPRANPQPVRQQMASRDMYAQQDGNYYGRSSSDGREGLRSPSPGRSSSPSQGLPPGAMNAPMPGDQSWYNSPRTSTSQLQRSNEYSSNDWLGDWSLSTGAGSVEGGAKLPARSLSANAVPVNNNAQHANLRKKVNSVTAVDSNRRPRSSDGNEEEDVPLAVWQQQRRR